jgi:hypothetical protein
MPLSYNAEPGPTTHYTVRRTQMDHLQRRAKRFILIGLRFKRPRSQVQEGGAVWTRLAPKCSCASHRIFCLQYRHDALRTAMPHPQESQAF